MSMGHTSGGGQTARVHQVRAVSIAARGWDRFRPDALNWMNIVHVFPYSARVSGGHSNAIRSFIACQRAKGINAVGISPKPDERAVEVDWGFPLAEVDSIWTLGWESVAERFGLRVGKSLLHLHSVDRRYTPWLGDLRRAGVPYVLTSHGQLSYRSAWGWLKKFVYLNLVDRGPTRAAGLQVLTKLAVRHARCLLPGFRGATLVQGNLLSLPNLAALPPAARSEYGIPGDAFVVIFLGRLDVRVKGLDFLVEAFARLPSSRARLLLAGPDWNQGKVELEQLAVRCGCGERICFTGPVYGDKKWSLLRMADLFVSPSRWEAFNIAQAEAMAVGLPVLTSTKVNLAPELGEADAAVLVPPAVRPLTRAIGALEADPERRRALGAQGKAWADRNCDPDRAGVRFAEFYHSILEGSRSTSG